MLKIIKNSNTFESTLDTVLKGIKEPNLISRIKKHKPDLIKEFESYEDNTTKGNGFKIPIHNFSKRLNIDPLVVGSLRHSELSSIYSSHFVPERLDSRVIYNTILASSVEGCPYCGGIGSVKELDHFLPKSKYPQFSLLTSNLVPSCKICNQDLKKSKFAEVYEDQIIHPYNDFNIFFEDKWIDVNFNPNHEKKIEFFVSPPDSWSESDKKRADFHFKLFDLAERYSTFIAGEYLNTKQSIENLRLVHDNQFIIDCILQHVIDGAKTPNDCRRILYEALKRDLLSSINPII
ncbi:HNH endonuclease [Psychrobacter frigidicola]|uniref:HNH endonuclease n=1 Tax=Psychrobacter frigidicola TaxID=45611 RepID=UPI00191B1B2A|nr:HNH endonuclease [Psychrobacter frigidicola]